MLTKNWEGKVILIVEDDVISLEFLKELFEPYKVRLLTADNGKDAISLCENNEKIDLILMDVQLPVLNGKDAMRQIKQGNPEIPVVAQTAFAMSGDKERYLKDGFDEYISKPINVNDLLLIIEKYFG